MKGFPSNVASGEQITLNDSADSRFNEFIIKGNSIQNGEPTPESPIEIQNLEGSVNITVANENLLLNGYSTPKTDTEFWASTSGNFTPLEDGWGRFVADNVNGNSPMYTNAFISFKKFKNIIKSRTTYKIIIEFRNLKKSGDTKNDYFCLCTGAGDEPFVNKNFYINDLSTNNKFIFNLSPYNYETTIVHLFRSFLSASAGNSISLEVRVSLLEENSNEIDIHVANQKFVFPLQEGQKLYESSYLAEDGVHHIKAQKVVDGTENWTYYSANAEWARPYFQIENKKIGEANNAYNVMCNKMAQGMWNTASSASVNKNVVFTYDGDRRISFLIKKSDLDSQDVAGVQKYFQENNMIVEYNLEEVVVEKYTDEQQKVYNEIVNTAKTYKNVTNIFSSNEISPKFEINYRRDIETYIDNKLANTNAQLLNFAGGN